MRDVKQDLEATQEALETTKDEICTQIQRLCEDIEDVFAARTVWLTRDESWRDSDEGKAVWNENMAAGDDLFDELNARRRQVEIIDQRIRDVGDALRAFA